MGWHSAGGAFDTVAQTLIDHDVPDEAKTRICSTLIEIFLNGDWSTADLSLAYFASDNAIVEAFRQYGVYIHCCHEDDDGDLCALERNHLGDHANEYGDTWPATAGT